jgi:hypothetical protein
MTFTDKEQKECRQMTWSAACHADFIGKSLDELLADYTKLNVARRQAHERGPIKATRNSDSAIDMCG